MNWEVNSALLALVNGEICLSFVPQYPRCCMGSHISDQVFFIQIGRRNVIKRRRTETLDRSPLIMMCEVSNVSVINDPFNGRGFVH